MTSDATTTAFDAWVNTALAEVERRLDAVVGVDAPPVLGQAMRHGVLGGGKRLRPLLVLAAAEAVGAMQTESEAAWRAACAVELIHAFSLVHDDMPCMDDDVLRRGQPTVHVKYGEAQALLAGDALQALAFEVLTPAAGGLMPCTVQAALCRLLARASGAAGMAGGQAIDLDSVGKRLNETELRHMHRLKTGALLQASVDMGAACATSPAPSAQAVEALSRYGALLGLAFQVVDDILDVTADSAALGKTAGKDAASDKPTYVSILGLDPSRQLALQLLQDAHVALAQTGLTDTRHLAALAEMVVHRQN